VTDEDYRAREHYATTRCYECGSRDHVHYRCPGVAMVDAEPVGDEPMNLEEKRYEHKRA